MRHLVLSNKNVDRARVQNRRDQNRPKNQSSKSQKKMQRKSRKENENLQLPLLQIHLLIQKLNQNNHERNCCIQKLFFYFLVPEGKIIFRARFSRLNHFKGRAESNF